MLAIIVLLTLTGITRGMPSQRRSICGGISGLNQCGGFYPTDFCCPSGSQCVPVNASVVAVICCPQGVDCRSIQPTTCDPSAYDASKAPSNQIHIQPVQNLTSCGAACCPPGFECHNGNCNAITANMTTTSPSQASQSPGTASTIATNMSTSAASSIADVQAIPASFSGSSFAAGFVPGIVLGIAIVCVILCFLRRSRSAEAREKTAGSRSYPPTLPPMISISQPSDLAHHRSDFLRSTSQDESRPGHSSTSSESHLDHSSAGSTDLRPMLNFDSGYAQPRSPSPALLHRALSFRFSPQGKLRNKQSMHSLRRYMDTQGDTPSIDRSDSSKSTGTIKVAFPPEESPWYGQPPRSLDTRPSTPTRASRLLQPNALGSPYTPSRYAESFVEPRRSDRRVTTFSSLMEKAGFRRREFEDL